MEIWLIASWVQATAAVESLYLGYMVAILYGHIFTKRISKLKVST